jgi:cytidylate kinase
MENLFLKYMSERLEFKTAKHMQRGPVITISRECGCPGNALAEMLANKLNQKLVREGLQPKWKWVNKEILQQASEELKMNPGDVETYLKAKESGVLQDLVNSFTETYHIRNASIKKVIFDVIRNLALSGHVIIVGRGGGAIAWDIPKALHLYLEAPLSWKAGVISTQKSIPVSQARKFVLERDAQRAKFRDNYRTKYSDEIYYDERFNCKTLSNEQICELVFRSAELKKLI